MKNILKTAIVAVVISMFASCSNPLDKVYNEETFLDDVQTIIARDKVSKEEMENLAYYMVYVEIEEISIKGKTYRELIEAANVYTEEK